MHLGLIKHPNFRLALEGRISDVVRNHLTYLFELWEQTGFTRQDRNERISVVERQVDQTLTEMIDEEKKNFDELLKVTRRFTYSLLQVLYYRNCLM
jgi:hypothetical protein